MKTDIRRLTPTSIAVLLLGSTALAAQDGALPDITVFAYQTEIDADRAGVSVEVVEEDEARRQPLRYADRLEQLPGITVAGNGGVGGVTYLRIRGLDQKYIGVRVDGIDVTDPAATQTNFDWGSLSGATLGRTEILKGSSSAIYGANAVGGVVNIRSPRPDEMGTVVQTMAEVGTYQTLRGALSVQTRGQRGFLSFNIARTETEGFSASAAPGNDEADGFWSTQVNLAGEYEVSDTVRLGGALYWLDSQNEFDEFETVPPYALVDGTPDERATTKALGARAYVEAETGAVTHTFAASTFQSDRTSTSNGFARMFDGGRQKLEYKGVWDNGGPVAVTFGAEAQRERLTTGGTTYEVDTAAAFAEALWSPDGQTDLALSLRYDDHETFGDNVSGRIAGSYRPMEDLILRAAVSTGFRSPSLYELFGPFGNAALEQEKSLSAELGVEKQFAGGFVKATLFQNRVENLIDYSFATSSYAQVPGQTRIRGLEVWGEVEVSAGVAVFGSYTLTDTRTASGGRLLRVPRHDLALGVAAELGRDWSGDVTLQHFADRPAEFGTAMPDYTTVSLGAAYRITDDAEAYLRVENLLDEDYQTAAGYASTGRAAFVGVRASF